MTIDITEIRILLADLSLAEHREAILELTNAYAHDKFGQSGPLSPEVQSRLLDGLASHPTTRVLIALEHQRPLGLATCFLGFSTFKAQPLLNIHDLAVVPAARGKGVGRKLLAAVDDLARELGCCKITLEVLENNALARGLYERCGFGTGGSKETTLFLTKTL